MTGKEQIIRNEPQKGIKPLFLASLAGAALLLSSCTAPIQDAFQRMGSARNTTFVAKASCPSIEGEMNNALFYLVEPTTSLKIEDGLVFKGKAYTNGYYIFCLMENASNGYVLEPNGNLVGVLKKASNGNYMDGSKVILKNTGNNAYELVDDSEFTFGQTFGKFALRRSKAGSSGQSLPQPTPFVQERSPEESGKIEFIQSEADSSRIISVALIGGLLAFMCGSIVYVIRTSRGMYIANRNRNHGPSSIPDTYKPDPKILKKDPIPTYRFPPSHKQIPPAKEKERETVSLMDD